MGRVIKTAIITVPTKELAHDKNSIYTEYSKVTNKIEEIELNIEIIDQEIETKMKYQEGLREEVFRLGGQKEVLSRLLLGWGIKENIIEEKIEKSKEIFNDLAKNQKVDRIIHHIEKLRTKENKS
jgi:hypothetical protein